MKGIQNKISPVLRTAMEDLQHTGLKRMSTHAKLISMVPSPNEGQVFLRVILECNDEKKSLRLPTDVHGTVIFDFGTIRTAIVPLHEIGILAENDLIEYVYPSLKLKLLVDQAHSAIGLPILAQRFPNVDGTNVAIAVIDSGLDWSHPDFCVNRQGEKISRVLHLWDQTLTGYGAGKIPYGLIYDNKQITDAINGTGSVLSQDEFGHGTHVTGISAGNGNASKGQMYKGIAPNADIIVVKANLETATLIEAIKYVFGMASSKNKPVVVNLSLGHHAGSHDGTDPLEKQIDKSTRQGGIVVVAAGNECRDPIHAATRIATDKHDEFSFRIPKGNQGLSLHCWYRSRDAIEFAVMSPDGSSSPVAGPGQEIDTRLFGCPISIKNEMSTNGDCCAYITIMTSNFPRLVSPLNEWKILMHSVKSSCGRIDAWLTDAENEYAAGFTSHVDDTMLVSIPGTSSNAITVASFISRTEWADLNDNIRSLPGSLNEISPFSSSGPTRQNGKKPDICAPGEWIIAPRSSHSSLESEDMEEFIPKDGSGLYISQAGTSMAAPVVTGVIALMLQQDPSLDPAVIKSKIINSHVSGSATWDRFWGYGRIDVTKLF
ncbi:MAG: S8 family serine peptidase [Nitrososphaeraceae archaeon]